MGLTTTRCVAEMYIDVVEENIYRLISWHFEYVYLGCIPFSLQNKALWVAANKVQTNFSKDYLIEYKNLCLKRWCGSVL